MKNFFATLTLTILSFQSNAIELYGLENSSKHTLTPLKVETSSDPDVKRAVRNEFFISGDTEYMVIDFKDGNRHQWKLQVFQNQSNPNGPTFFVPHDNENEAFQAAARGIQRFGGHLISLSCSEERFCRGIDPNRYFVLNTRHDLFVKTIMKFFEAKEFPVITLHNNMQGHKNLGGSGSIYADIAKPYEGGFARYHSGDADDLIIYADTKGRRNSDVFSKFDGAFKDLGLNSIYEYVSPNADIKGHMSSYVLINTDKLYFNVEAQHGRLTSQRAYLRKLMSLL